MSLDFNGLLADRVFSFVWDGEVSIEDRAIFTSLPPARRSQVLRRLLALRLAELPRAERTTALGRILGLAEVQADDAKPMSVMGESKAGFFAVQASWKAGGRTLAAIAPFATTRGRGASRFPDVEVAVRESIAATPDAEVADVIAHAKGAGLSLPANNTLRRIVREEMARQRADMALSRPQALARLVMDAVTVRVAIETATTAEWALLAVLFEPDSGLIMGHGIGPAADGLALLDRAVAAAEGMSANLRARALKPSLERPFEIFPSEAAEALGWDRTLRSILARSGTAHLLVGDREEYRPSRPLRVGGSNAVPRFAKKIGAVELLPRIRSRDGGGKLTAAELARWPVYPPEEAQALMRRAVERHNEPIEAAMVKMKLLSA